MAASRMFLILLSIALLSLTSAQRDNADGDNTQEEGQFPFKKILDVETWKKPLDDLHEGINELVSHNQEQIVRYGNMAKNFLKSMKGQGRNRESGGIISRLQDHLNGNQQESGGRRGKKGRKGLRRKHGKGRKRNQEDNDEEVLEE